MTVEGCNNLELQISLLWVYEEFTDSYYIKELALDKNLMKINEIVCEKVRMKVSIVSKAFPEQDFWSLTQRCALF